MLSVAGAAAVFLGLTLVLASKAQAAGTTDCNTNGVPDAGEVLAGSASDFNTNGVPDECDTMIRSRFEGPDRPASGSLQPPDPSVAVGPNHVVAVVTNEITVYDRDGGVLTTGFLNDFGEPGFFEGVGAVDLLFDPMVVYDHHSDRFVLVTSESSFDDSTSWLLLAVSRTSDPTDLSSAGWLKYRSPAPIVAGSPAWVNFPMLGMDERGIYIAGNLLKGISTYTHTALIRVISRSMLLAGFESLVEGIHYHDFVVQDGYTILPARTYGDAPVEYLIQLDCQPIVPCHTDRAILYSIFTPPAGTPTLNQVDITLPEMVHGPAYGSPENFAPDADDPVGVYASDASFLSAVWRSGRLYTAHSIFPAQDDLSTRIVRWYEIETGGWTSGPPQAALAVQSGDVDLGVTAQGNPIFAYLPSIAVNRCGHMGMVMARSSVEEYPGIYVTAARRETDGGWLLPDPAPVVRGLMPTPALKWGDYFLVTLDAADDATFWSIGELAAPIPIRYTTWIASFSPAGDASVPVGDLDSNGVLDECEDCNANAIPDATEITPATDCNANGILDACEIADRRGDCNANGLIDFCEIAAGSANDCSANGVPDECDLLANYWPASDCNANNLMDACETRVAGDHDNDLAVNLSDYESLAGCFTGPGAAPVALTAGCEALCLVAFDADDDGDIDLDDFRGFQQLFGGE